MLVAPGMIFEAAAPKISLNAEPIVRSPPTVVAPRVVAPAVVEPKVVVPLTDRLPVTVSLPVTVVGPVRPVSAGESTDGVLARMLLDWTSAPPEGSEMLYESKGVVMM